MEMPDRYKLPLHFDPGLLQSELQKLRADEWISHFVTQNYDGDWNVLPLRGPKGETHPIRMAYSDPSCDEFEDTPFLHRCDGFQKTLEAFPFPLQAVRLMSLAPGSRIKTHFDHDLSYEDGQVRLHIPIATNKDVVFKLNDIPVDMVEGECWYLRLCDPHTVYNGGNNIRVHLVIDAAVTEPLTSYFESLDVDQTIIAPTSN